MNLVSCDEVRQRLQNGGLPAALCTRTTPAGRPAKLFLDGAAVKLTAVIKDLSSRKSMEDPGIDKVLELDDLERIELGEDAGRRLGGDAGAALEAAVAICRKSGFMALSAVQGEMLCVRFASATVCDGMVALLLERCPWVARPDGDKEIGEAKPEERESQSEASSAQPCNVTLPLHEALSPEASAKEPTAEHSTSTDEALHAVFGTVLRERDELQRRVTCADAELMEMGERLELYEQQAVAMMAMQSQLQAEKVRREQMTEEAQQQAKAYEDRLISGEQQMDQLARKLRQAQSALEEQLHEEAARRRSAELRAESFEKRLAEAEQGAIGKGQDIEPTVEGAISERLRGECEQLRLQVSQELAKCGSAQAQVAALEARLSSAAAASVVAEPHLYSADGARPDLDSPPSCASTVLPSELALQMDDVSAKMRALQKKEDANQKAGLLIEDLERQLANVELSEVALARRQLDMEALIHEQGELRQVHKALEQQLQSEARKQDICEAAVRKANAQHTSMEAELAGAENMARMARMAASAQEVCVDALNEKLSVETLRRKEAVVENSSLRWELAAAEEVVRQSRFDTSERAAQEAQAANTQAPGKVFPAPIAVVVYQDHSRRSLPPSHLRKTLVPSVRGPIARSTSPTQMLSPRFGTGSGQVSPRSGPSMDGTTRGPGTPPPFRPASPSRPGGCSRVAMPTGMPATVFGCPPTPLAAPRPVQLLPTGLACSPANAHASVGVTSPSPGHAGRVCLVSPSPGHEGSSSSRGGSHITKESCCGVSAG